MGMLRDGLQRFTLAWRAGQPRVVEAGAFGQMPETLLARFGGLALAQQDRQRPTQGVAKAVLVILRRPQTQPEQRRRQRRAGIQQFQGGAELVVRNRAAVGQFHQYADHLAPAERHPQPNAGQQCGMRHAGRGAIVEQSA